MWWFTADQHFDHTNIMKHCNRPFSSVEEMNEHMIEIWNKYITGADVVIVAGDWTLHHKRQYVYEKFTKRVRGNVIFLKGNHDWWLKGDKYIYHRTIKGQGIAVSHYPMRTWKNHQHGWWNLHGHSHGTLAPLYNQLDIGVDVAFQFYNEYRPFSFEEIKQIMEERKTTEEEKWER